MEDEGRSSPTHIVRRLSLFHFQDRLAPTYWLRFSSPDKCRERQRCIVCGMFLNCLSRFELISFSRAASDKQY